MSRTEIAVVQWAQKITEAWRKSSEAIFETGRLLREAKDGLEHGEWTALVTERLPFSLRTAQRIMAVSVEELRLKSDAGVASALPGDWSTLYEISRLPPEQLQRGVEAGVIRPDATRNDVRHLVQATKRAERQAAVDGGGTVEDLQGLVDAGTTFAAICADPPWTYETWSDKGATRSAVQHYQTMTLEDIGALPVQKLAAPDCILHLWIVSTLLDPALDIMTLDWGFEYKKIGFIWRKPELGMGHWTRDEAEICLLGTRGNPKRASMDVRQVIDAPVGRHSEKPEEFRVRVERLTAGPYLELFGRTPRPGWTVWGNQIPWVAPE